MTKTKIIWIALAAALAFNRLMAGEPLIVAHRGASHEAPENTLAAFRLAWQQGADAIEGDFYLTRDRHIVCIHDATTKRTADRNLTVAQATLAQLRALNVGSWKGNRWRGERIPTLEEVLGTVPPGKKLFLEIKSGPELVPVLKTALAKSPLRPDQVVIIAFDAKVIAAAKRELPAYQAYWLTGYKQQPKTGEWQPTLSEIVTTLKRIQADGLDSQAHPSIDASFVQALRRAHYPLHVWTVDDPAVARRFRQLGVASLTTNRPRWLREQLQRSPGR